MSQKPREIAIQLLVDYSVTGPYVENRVDQALDASQLSPADRRLVRQIVCGVVRWQGVLDWLIEQRTQGGRRQRSVVQVALRVGLFQLFWLDRGPAHAAVHETLEAAKARGVQRETGFMNAVMRHFQREREATQRQLADLERARPWLAQSQPRWLWERWRARWGDEAALALMKWNNTPPRNFVRLNHLKPEAADLPARWQAAGITCRPFQRDWYPENWIYELESPGPVTALPGFDEGHFYVQDPGTLLAVHLLDPRPGETILDACAAPGGKTVLIAQRLENRGTLLAHDVEASRLGLIRENCLRLGVDCVRVIDSWDGVSPQSCDRILIDAPCSNTGVMSRRVDLRWRIREEELERLQSVQLGLLKQCAPQVKPGGCVVYSTCSLEAEENEQVVKRFLDGNPGFRLDVERAVTPITDQVDGAYAARLIRNPDADPAELASGS